MSGLNPFKKKSPGPDTSAITQQQQLEAQKHAARERLNKVFGIGDDAAMAARRKIYDDTAGAARELNTRYLTEDRDRAQAAMKANLYRSGLFGSSVDLEGHSELGRRYNQGLIDVGNNADALRRSLEADDEGARLDLLDKINGGMDESSVLSAGTTRLANAANTGMAQARGRFIGNLFNDMASTYDAYQFGQGRQSMAGQTPMPAGYGARTGQRTYRY